MTVVRLPVQVLALTALKPITAACWQEAGSPWMPHPLFTGSALTDVSETCLIKLELLTCPNEDTPEAQYPSIPAGVSNQARVRGPNSSTL